MAVAHSNLHKVEIDAIRKRRAHTRTSIKGVVWHIESVLTSFCHAGQEMQGGPYCQLLARILLRCFSATAFEVVNSLQVKPLVKLTDQSANNTSCTVHSRRVGRCFLCYNALRLLQLLAMGFTFHKQSSQT